MSNTDLLIVEPLGRCTGHHSWYLIQMSSAFQAVDTAVESITFSGFHGDSENPIPGFAVYARWGRIGKWLYRFFINVSTESVVPSEYAGQLGKLRYALFSHLSLLTVTTAGLTYASQTGIGRVLLLEPLTLFAALNLLARRVRPTVIATMFVTPPSQRGWSPQGLYSRALRWTFGRLFKQGRFHVVVQTEPLRKAWADAFGGSSVTLIPLGVGQSAAAIDREAEKRRLGLPTDRPIVAVLGAIRPAKGYVELLSAFKGHPKPCYFLLAGDRPEWAPPDPRDVARENGCEPDTLFWLRFVPEDEFATLLAAVDVVAMLYRNPEGSSGILSRCLEAGTPVLATCHGHLGDVVRSSGAGQTADPNSPHDVRRALEELLATSRTSPKPASPNALPDWPMVARRYLDLFDRLGWMN